MGLNNRVFSDAWADTVFDTWKIFTNAEIEIYTPGLVTYNADSGKYEADPKNPKVSHWSGSARLKDVRSSERNLVEGDDARAQYFRVQIARNSVVLKDTMQMRVTSGGLVDDMKNWIFYVVDFYNQSGAFEQTFMVSVNSGRP